MTAPAAAALRFLLGLVLGAGLGLVYGFLRPLRPRWTALADLLFVGCALWAWVVLSFAVCRGDIRLGYTAALGIGAISLEKTIGRLLRPVWIGFWRAIGAVKRLMMWPLRKFSEFFGKIFKKYLHL